MIWIVYFLCFKFIMFIYVQVSEWKLLSRVWLFAAPWTVARQAPLSLGFSRQEYWSGLQCPSPGDLPDPGIKPRSPALQVDSLPSEPPGKPYICMCMCMYIYMHMNINTHTYNGFITWSILTKFSRVLYGRRNNDFFQGSMETYCSCFTCLIAKAGLLKQGRKGIMWFLDWGMSTNVDGTDQQQRPTVEDSLETQASMCVQFLLPARQVEQNKGWYSKSQLALHYP